MNKPRDTPSIACFLIMLFVCSSALAQTVRYVGPLANGTERGGGGVTPSEFKNYGREAINNLRRWAQTEGGNALGVDLDALERVIDVSIVNIITPTSRRSPVILVDRCGYHPEMAILPECVGRIHSRNTDRRRDRIRLTVTAINNPRIHLVEIFESRWLQSGISEDQKKNLALHEFLSLAGLSDRSYEISFFYWFRLHDERDLAVFRSDARQVVDRLASAELQLLSPVYDDILGRFTAYRSTTDYDNCVNRPETEHQLVGEGAERLHCESAIRSIFTLPRSTSGEDIINIIHGTFPEGMNRRLCSCMAMAQSFMDGTRAGLSHQGNDQAGALERVALAELNAFAQRASTIARQNLVVQSAQGLINFTAEQQRGTVLHQFGSSGDVVAVLDRQCPRSLRFYESVPCAFEYLSHLLNVVAPMEYNAARQRLGAERDRILSQISSFSEGAAQVGTSTSLDPHGVIPGL